DAIDHLNHVGALTHDDDSGDGLAEPVEIGDPPAHFRPQRDFADVLHPHDLRAPATGDHRLFEFTRVAQIAAPADHVLRAAELHQPASGLDVAPPHRLHHGGERDAHSA